MSRSKRDALEQLIENRKEVLARISVASKSSRASPEYKRLKAIEKRRLIKAKLAAINLAIKAAGGRIQGGKRFSVRVIVRSRTGEHLMMHEPETRQSGCSCLSSVAVRRNTLERPMARLLAIAFHEAVSVEKLSELFRSDTNQLFAGTAAVQCPSCRRRFAVFFPQLDDPDNVSYLGRIEELVAVDCQDGKHSAEVSLSFG